VTLRAASSRGDLELDVLLQSRVLARVVLEIELGANEQLVDWLQHEVAGRGVGARRFDWNASVDLA
jgi:hypothetical protein